MGLNKLGTYNPRSCVTTVDGNVISGWGADSMIEFSRHSDELGEIDVGVQGAASWSLTADEVIGAELTLSPNHASYARMSALAKAQYTATGALPPVSFNFVDTISGDSVQAQQALFRTQPMPVKGKKNGDVVFSLWLVNPTDQYGVNLI